MPTIRIPTALQAFTGGNGVVEVSGKTVGAALTDLTNQHPKLYAHLFEEGELRSYVNIYLNKEDVRYLDGAETEVAEDDTLMILPSIAGGQ